MQTLSLISTKGGVGKTTTAANLAALMADAGLRVLLIDLDVQPTLSSYFPLQSEAIGGIFQFVALNETRFAEIISKTQIERLDLIKSNDDSNLTCPNLSYRFGDKIQISNKAIEAQRFRTRTILSRRHFITIRF